MRSTSETDAHLFAKLGNHDCALKVHLAPDGTFEVEITDYWGERVGYITPPKDGAKGIKVIKGKLNTDAKKGN